MSTIQLTVFFFAVVIAVAIIVLMIKQKCTTGFALVWLFIAFVAMLNGLFPELLNIICVHLGISYPPTLVFIAAITALIIISFYIYSQISASQRVIKMLSVKISLLEDELEEHKLSMRSAEARREADPSSAPE